MVSNDSRSSRRRLKSNGLQMAHSTLPDRELDKKVNGNIIVLSECSLVSRFNVGDLFYIKHPLDIFPEISCRFDFSQRIPSFAHLVYGGHIGDEILYFSPCSFFFEKDHKYIPLSLSNCLELSSSSLSQALDLRKKDISVFYYQHPSSLFLPQNFRT